MGTLKTIFALMTTLLVVSCGSGNATLQSSPGGDGSPALVAAVKAAGGHSADGAQKPLLCTLAAQQAQYMVSAQTISHDGWPDRTAQIQQAGGTSEGEIVAYTSLTDPNAAATSCANSWLNSPGHWAIMQPAWDGYCYTMLLGKDGYYCIGIMANGLP